MILPEAEVAACAACLCGYIDARTGLIPNRITYPAFCLLIAAALWQGRLPHALIGALCVGGTLLFLYLITRRRGLGFGDVKLGFCIGAGLGAAAGMIALGSSFILGGMYGAYLLAAGRAGRKDAVRFGPFLAFGTIFTLCLSSWGFSWPA